MLHDCCYLVLDIETGGLWSFNNPLIEIALIGLDHKMDEVLRYENYVKPYDNLKVEPGALQANGIKMSDVEEKGIEVEKLYKDLIAVFKQLKSGRKKPVLVGHNICSFDLSFLEYIFDKFEERDKKKKSGLFKYIEDFVEDTMWLSRKKWGHLEVSNHKLESVCERAGIALTDAHRAMNDTEATAELFKYFVKEMRTGGGGIIGEEVKEKEYEREFQF